jgi:hypothetical protein
MHRKNRIELDVERGEATLVLLAGGFLGFRSMMRRDVP